MSKRAELLDNDQAKFTIDKKGDVIIRPKNGEQEIDLDSGLVDFLSKVSGIVRGDKKKK